MDKAYQMQKKARAAHNIDLVSDPAGTIINRSLGTSKSQIAIRGGNIVIRKKQHIKQNKATSSHFF
jgi:hypothetical protein